MESQYHKENVLETLSQERDKKTLKIFYKFFEKVKFTVC